MILAITMFRILSYYQFYTVLELYFQPIRLMLEPTD